MELFTATGKLKKIVCSQLQQFAVCPMSDTEHSDTIFQFLPHTHVNMGTSVFFTAAMIRAFRAARSRGNGWDEYCARNARCTVTTDLLCHIPTHKTTSPPRSGHFLTTYTRIAQRQKCELRRKTTAREKLICCFCLYRFGKYVYCGFTITNFCNPGVQNETPCIFDCFFLFFKNLPRILKPH